MIIKHFERLVDIPEIEGYYTKLPVFATQEYADYLQEVRKCSTIWFCGIINADIRFIIPFAVRRKYIFNKGEFLTATICLGENNDTETEKEFLNSTISVIKKNRMCDWIEQPANWALFNTVPTNSIFCDFGTYRIDLMNNSEDELYKKVDYHHKRLIKKSIKNNVIIKSGLERFEDCATVFNEATANGNHTLPTKNELKKLIEYLPKYINTYVSYNNSVPKSSIVFFLNKYCVYGVYIGNISSMVGENHFLHWQAIKDAKNNGIKYFDFIGARINPTKGSKQEGIQKFKKYFGGEFIKGFLWKMPISNNKYYLYNLLVKVIYFFKSEKFKGDIIDQELKRIKE